MRIMCQRHGFQIQELAVMPDHIHLLVGVPPSVSLSKALQFIKGGSSHEFLHLHPEFRLRYRKGHLFGPGKFCRSVGSVDLDTTKEYVRRQKEQMTLESFLKK